MLYNININKKIKIMVKKLKWLISSLLIVMMLGFLFQASSCEKDNSGGQDCDCGSAVSYDVDSYGYYVRLRNYCSGNYEWFSIDYTDYLYGEYGDEFCSSGSWKSGEFAKGNNIGTEPVEKETLEKETVEVTNEMLE